MVLSSLLFYQKVRLSERKKGKEILNPLNFTCMMPISPKVFSWHEQYIQLQGFTHLWYFWLKKILVYKPGSDFRVSIWYSLEEVRTFQAWSVRLHHVRGWAICFLCPVCSHLLFVPCVCCGTSCTSPYQRGHQGSRALFTAERINPFDFWTWRQYKRNSSLWTFCPSLYQLEMLICFLMCLGTSVAQIAGGVRVRSCGSIQWSRSLQRVGTRLRETGEEEDSTKRRTKGRKTRDRDHAKRGHKGEDRHIEKGHWFGLL